MTDTKLKEKQLRLLKLPESSKKELRPQESKKKGLLKKKLLGLRLSELRWKNKKPKI